MGDGDEGRMRSRFVETQGSTKIFTNGLPMEPGGSSVCIFSEKIVKSLDVIVAKLVDENGKDQFRVGRRFCLQPDGAR